MQLIDDEAKLKRVRKHISEKKMQRKSVLQGPAFLVLCIVENIYNRLSVIIKINTNAP